MTRVNWVDFLVLFIIARSIYMGRTSGTISQLFNLIGSILSTFITLHYYTQFGSFLKDNFSFLSKVSYIIAFATVATLSLLIFFLIREGWLLILRVTEHNRIDRTIGIILAVINGYVVAGLIVFGILVTNNLYALEDVRNSLSDSVLGIRQVSVNIYEKCFSFIEEYFPDEKINKKVIFLAGKRHGYLKDLKGTR